jgi:hypothetical protein
MPVKVSFEVTQGYRGMLRDGVKVKKPNNMKLISR